MPIDHDTDAASAFPFPGGMADADKTKSVNPRLRRTAMTPGVNKIANIIIPVADQDRQVQFYTEVLGLQKRVGLVVRRRFSLDRGGARRG
jgi:hypothetical protein